MTPARAGAAAFLLSPYDKKMGYFQSMAQTTEFLKDSFTNFGVPFRNSNIRFFDLFLLLSSHMKLK